MARDSFSHNCQNCGGELKINRLSCGDCGLSVAGRIALPRLARLSGADREFVEMFVLAAGSLKEVGRMMGLSYPTVRARLDRIIGRLKELDEGSQAERMGIIRRLERGEISVEEAARELALQ